VDEGLTFILTSVYKCRRRHASKCDLCTLPTVQHHFCMAVSLRNMGHL